MARTAIVATRLTPQEYDDLRGMAERCARTPSDLLRQLVRQVDVRQLTIGVPSPALPEASADARETVAA